jgi:hypothetical protein
MVVAVDVKNMDDMLLLPQGCELGERHIGILQAWGIAEIQVETAPDSETTNDPLARLTPEALTALKAELTARFFQPDETNPGFIAVFQAVLRRRAAKY